MTMNKIFKLADKFTLKLQKRGQMPSMSSITPDQVVGVLNKNNLWGGIPFDPNGKIADVIFNTMNKIGFQGKFDASLIIGPNYDIKIMLTSSNPKTNQLQIALQNYFGPRMSQVLKQSKIPPPDGDLSVGWLSGVANIT